MLSNLALKFPLRYLQNSNLMIKWAHFISYICSYVQ